MAGKIRGLLGRLFGRGKPKPPSVPGHRGIAAESLANPDLTSYGNRIARGQTNEISPDELEDFLAGGNPIFVHSSNLRMTQYYPETEQLQIEYKNGSAYLYGTITEVMARSFLHAQSKGSWVWSNLRIRGTKNGHRVPFRRIK